MRRNGFAETRIVEHPAPDLAAGEILARIDKFALTANNVTYAFSGDSIGYWRFFPAAEPWGIVPVWGFADVVASKHPDIPVGDRMWGFLPMASHVVMRPDKVAAGSFTDSAAHRSALPALYNNYRRTEGDPPALKALENERCLLFPLFSTSYVLYDYLLDNEFFGAKQILVGSASSKTGLGLCNLISRHGEDRPQVIGLTSPANVDFVTALGTCDHVATYDQISGMDGDVPSGFVDMAGNGAVVTAIHDKFDANLKVSTAVGVTHWEAGLFSGETKGAAHTFFFAPSQFGKRDAEWGPGVIMRRAQTEAARMAEELKGVLTIRKTEGATDVAAAWSRLVAGELTPDVAIMAAISG